MEECRSDGHAAPWVFNNNLIRPLMNISVCLKLIAATVLVCALPALAQTAPKSTVALVMKSLANEFFLTMENGAMVHQKAHADQYDLIANGIKDEQERPNQIKLVEQVIVSKVSGMLIAPADSKALVPFVCSDNRQGAKLVGDYLAKQIKSGDMVTIIESVSTTINA